MASKIQLKKSNVTGRIPDPADLDWGEIALNYLDGKLFYKQHGTGTVQVLNTDTNTVTRLRGNAGVTITGVFITQATNPGGQFGCDPTTLSVGDLVTISGTPGPGYIQNYTSPTTYKVSALVGTSPNVTGFTLTTVDDIALTTSYGYTPNLTYTTGGTYTSGDLTLLAGTNITITQSGSDYTIASAGGSDPTKLPLTGGTVTGLVTFTYDAGSQGWSNIVIDASTSQNGAFIRANRASAATGEVGYAWGQGGTNQWINYLPTNSTTLQWYQGSAVVMSLTAAGTLNASNLTANNNQVLHAGNYNSYAPTLTGTGASGTWDISVTGSAASAASATTVSRGSGNIANVTAPGSGTYNQHVVYATNTEFGVEAALATDSLAGNKLPLVFTWRGGYDTLGGLKITGSSSAQLGGNAVLHAANYNSYALPLSGGTLTGSLIISGVENALDVQHNGTSTAWRGRIISRNADSDIATFLGNYNGKSGIFSHSNALNAWAPLYLNTLGSNGANIAYLPHANTYTISGDNTTYLILDASNYSSYALPLTGGTLTGTLTTVSGTTLGIDGGTTAADSYNYVLAAGNDAGNRLVVFVNGSARSADGGTNSVTIRNDGGTLNLGNSSHVTNLVGSSVVTATAAAGTNTTQIATTQFVQTAIANLVDTAPTTLDTLNELAAALGDDPNFATTVTNSLANKLNLTGGTLTGALTINADDGVKVIYGGTDGQTWYRGWGMESDRGAVYIRGTGNATQTLRIGYSEGSQSWNTVRIDASAFTHNGNTVWNAGNDGSGSGLDADLLDGIDSSGYWTKSGSWWGSNFAGSRLQGVSANNGEFVLIQDHPNVSQVSVLVDGAYIAGENNGFWMTPGNDWNTRYGFYWNGSQIDFRQGTAPVVFGGFVGIGNSFGSDDGSWGSRLNVGGAPHARIDVLCANDGIVTTMYSHQGQNAGKMGTMSNHRLELMANGGTKASILVNGNVGINTLIPEAKLHVDGTASDGQELIRITSDANLNNAGYHWMTSEMAASEANAHIIHLIGKAESSKNSGYFGFRYQGNSSNDNYITLGGYGADNLMVIKMNGNAGINSTTPAEKLEVGGNILAFGSSSTIPGSGTNIWLGSATNSRDIGFRRAGAGILAIDRYDSGWQESIRILLNGNIGINSTTPQHKLELYSGLVTGSGFSASVGSTIQAGVWTGIHFGFIQQNTANYRKSALAFERLDSNARGTIHILNNGSNDTTSATINDSKIAIFYTGNVNIGGVSDNGYKLEVAGSFAATTKSFVIPHPTKPGKKLRYGSLEGPENGVYVRGRVRGTKIELPDYWTALVDPDSITVQLTPIGRRQDVWVTKIVDNCVWICGTTQPDCYYFIQAERKDVDKLEVEID